MKYGDPKTGKIYETISTAWTAWHCPRPGCQGRAKSDCEFSETVCHMDWCNEHPTEAARLMGYEIIEEEEPMEETKKPRICEVLGVEVGESFEVEGFGGVVFWMLADGTFATEPPCATDSTSTLLRAIEHPDRIIRKPRWTDADVEDAKAMAHLFGPGWAAIDMDGSLFYHKAEPERHGDEWCSNSDFWPVCRESFPSLIPGQKARLADIAP